MEEYAVARVYANVKEKTGHSGSMIPLPDIPRHHLGAHGIVDTSPPSLNPPGNLNRENQRVCVSCRPFKSSFFEVAVGSTEMPPIQGWEGMTCMALSAAMFTAMGISVWVKNAHQILLSVAEIKKGHHGAFCGNSSSPEARTALQLMVVHRN